MKILFLQTGDFPDAYRRFAEGGAETYHEQKKSVDFVAGLAPDREVVVACPSILPGETVLAPGLKAIGLSRAELFRPGTGRGLIEKERPDLFLPRLPHAEAIEAAAARSIPTMPALADVMARPDPRDLPRHPRRFLSRYLGNRRLARALSQPAITAVGNHSLLASRSLQAVLGLRAERIVPWEWTRLSLGLPVRRHPRGGPLTALFVGNHTTPKGAGDFLEAILTLLEEGVPIRAVMAGDGPERDAYAARIAAAGAGGRIELPGHIPKAAVAGLMRDAHLAVMPSRPAYAEGLPNTVVDGLAHGLPLVISDHPAVVARLSDGRNCLVARAGAPADLARCIRRYVTEPDLYDRIADAAEAAYDSLFIGISWYDLVRNFIADPRDADGWVRRQSLAALDDAGVTGADG